MADAYGWHEDPERPGVFVPDGEPITLTAGQEISLQFTVEVVDGEMIVLPWAEAVVGPSQIPSQASRSDVPVPESLIAGKAVVHTMTTTFTQPVYVEDID